MLTNSGTSTSSERFLDRRKAPRAGLPIQVSCHRRGEESSVAVTGVIKDLSEAGVCFVGRVGYPVGTDVSLVVGRRIDGLTPFQLAGRVVWQKPIPRGLNGRDRYYLSGVRVSGTSGKNRERLAGLLARALTGHRQTWLSEAALATIIDRMDGQMVDSLADGFPLQTTVFRTTCARVVANGGLLPETVVNNRDIVEHGRGAFDLIVRRALGAVERRAAARDETNSVMMTKVAQQLLADSGVDATELTRIICSSDPQDLVAPNMASVVQSKIGAACPAYDIQMSCAGWICGVDNALRCLEGGESCILVLASSVVGSRLQFYNRRDRAIFGDGASGILLKRMERGEGKLMCTELWTDGRFHNEITAPLPWSPRPENIPQEYTGSFYMSPNQDLFFSTLSRVLPTVFERLVERAGVRVEDIDHFLLHQPTMPLFYHSLKVLSDIPREKVFNYYPKFGNIVAAEMPMMFHEGVRSGRIHPGDLVLMLTYGAGFTMAGWLFEY